MAFRGSIDISISIIAVLNPGARRVVQQYVTIVCLCSFPRKVKKSFRRIFDALLNVFCVLQFTIGDPVR